MSELDSLFSKLSEKNLSTAEVDKIVSSGVELAKKLGNNAEILDELETLKYLAESKKQNKKIEFFDNNEKADNLENGLQGGKKISDELLNNAYDEVAKKIVKCDLNECSEDEKAKMSVEILTAINEYHLDSKELSIRVNEQMEKRINEMKNKEVNIKKQIGGSYENETKKEGDNKEQEVDKNVKEYNEARQYLAGLLKDNLSNGSDNPYEVHYAMEQVKNSRKNIDMKQEEKESSLNAEKIKESVENSVRPTTAEVGKKKVERSFIEKIRDRIEVMKIDYKYEGIVGVFKRMKEGNGTFLRIEGMTPDKSWGHLRNLDFNRYPNMNTAGADLTNIDHVVFPDPSKVKSLNLQGAKLKGTLNLGAYDGVNLTNADLSKVEELDLSHCKSVDLTGVDLSRLKKLKLPKEGEICLSDAKLPKMDNLDFSKNKYVNMSNANFSKVDTVVMPEKSFIGRKVSWPKHIDASKCNKLNLQGANLDNVESIIVPQVSRGGEPSCFEMYGCKAPKLKKLDVSTAEKVCIQGCEFSFLEELKIRGVSDEKILETKAPRIRNIDVSYNVSVRNTDEAEKMFQTYKNICTAVALGQTVYKDAEKGKLRPLTEEQKDAVKFIKDRPGKEQNHLNRFWENMSFWQNNLDGLNGAWHFDSKTKTGMTQCNKALSQALGLSMYVDLETMQYRETPALKSGEKPLYPKLKFNSLGGLKDIEVNGGQKENVSDKSDNKVANLRMIRNEGGRP